MTTSVTSKSPLIVFEAPPPLVKLEAMQWTAGFRQSILDWTGGEFSSFNWDSSYNNGEPYDAIFLDDSNVWALDQQMRLGDWVLKRDDGSMFAVSDAVFFEKYNPSGFNSGSFTAISNPLES